MKIQIKSILRISVLVLLAVLIGVSIYSMNASMLGGNPLPMPFGFGMTVVLSGSMEPELSVDDFLIVVPADTYEVGDVVVFQNQRTAIVHRIVAINGDEIITRGDANTSDDDPITLANIKGKVAFVVPFVGVIINLIKTPIGTLLLIGLAVWLLEASFKKEKNKKAEELDAIRLEIEALKKDAAAEATPENPPENTPENTPNADNSTKTDTSDNEGNDSTEP